MKAPDKIYVDDLAVVNDCSTRISTKPLSDFSEYIRKDTLMKWAKKQFNLARKCMVEAERDWNRAYENGEMVAYDSIIKKLNSL